MNKNFKIEQMAATRWFYNYLDTNKIGEKLTIEITKCKNSGANHSLSNMWFKNGYTKEILNTYWCINVYVYDTEGACWGRYNPQEKLTEDGKRAIINFDFMFEATEENKQKLIDEVLRMFLSAEGLTATEEKINNVLDFAKQHNYEVVTEIPNGWKDIGGMTCPLGSTWICNMQSLLSGLRQTKLLLI